MVWGRSCGLIAPFGLGRHEFQDPRQGPRSRVPVVRPDVPEMALGKAKSLGNGNRTIVHDVGPSLLQRFGHIDHHRCSKMYFSTDVNRSSEGCTRHQMILADSAAAMAGNQDHIRERIRRVMELRGLRQKPWSLRAGLGANTLREFLQGSTSSMRNDSLE